jgi:hypothetical protein
MKTKDDIKTADFFPERRGRGRPSTGTAKTAAERMRNYRERRKAEGQPPTPAPPPLALSDLEELEQLREINAALEILVTSYEKEAAQHGEECRALNEQITRLMKTEAQLRRTVEDQARRIAELEAKRRRKPRA